MNQNSKINILVVEDDQDMREFIQEVLFEKGYAVTLAANGKEALERLEETLFPIVISDLKMPVMDGITLLEEINKREAIKPFVILITAFGDIDDAIHLINRGAYDYIIKPFKLEQLLIAVRKAANELTLRQKIEQLEQINKSQYSLHKLIGKSNSMRKLFSFIEKIANSSGNILLEGDTGTGKELIARAIHHTSTREDKPFIPVNCAAIPEGLLESELFGHVKGAFTDAHSDKKGLFAEAADGTLLLDEIGEMNTAIQAKILRALQERQIKPVGATRSVSFDARVIAATNKNLKAEVASGNFREDLYYRLNIFKIEVPPLRERREDIPLLVHEFLARHEHNGIKAELGREVMRFFLDYPWPGNIRELENVIERCAFLAEEGKISLGDLPEEMLAVCHEKEQFSFGEVVPLAEIEINYIKYVLDKCKGNKQKAASLLGINRKTIHRKLEP